MQKNILSISIIILSLSICFIGYQIGTTVNDQHKDDDLSINTDNLDKGLLTDEEIATYLSLSVDELETMINRQDIERSQLGSFSTYQFIPYITINNQKYFSKEEVNEWIKFNSLIWQEFE